MTAYHLPGDRERCLAAGMDDYLAKPITKDMLATMLAKWVPPKRETLDVNRERPDKQADGSDSGSPSHRSPLTAHASPSFDHAAALGRLGGDAALLRAMAKLFLSRYPAVMAEIQQALASGDDEGVLRAAHQLKGMLSNFHAGRATQRVSHLAAPSAPVDRQSAARACQELAEELVSLAKDLSALVQEAATCEC